MYRRQYALKPLTRSEKKREERRLRQTKRLNLILLCVVILGFIVIIVKLRKHDDVPLVLLDFRNQPLTIREWKQSGFIKSINDSTGTLVMNEAQWNDLPVQQREGVVIFLRRYYARRSNTNESKLIIKGDVSQQLLVSSDVVTITGK
jgi:hypothetical protein